MPDVPPGVEYHRVLAGEKRRVGRGIFAIVLLIAGMFGSIALFSLAGVWIELSIRPDSDPAAVTPITFGAGLLATALLIPWSMFLQRWLYGVPGPSLHSVVFRVRFALIGKAVVWVVPLFTVALGATELLTPGAAVGEWRSPDLVAMFVIVIVLVPLQAAGEEYGIRGLVFRVAGSWAHGRWVSLLLGLTVSTAVFSIIHTAGDPWWNVFYVVLSLVAGVTTWRTGGIEVAAVIHVVFNIITFTYWFIVGADLADRLDRSAGSVTPALFVPSVSALIVIGLVVWVGTRRAGPALTASQEQGL